MKRVLLCIVGSTPLLATDIEGVQMAAMDQPRVSVTVRRTPSGEPLAGKGDAGLAALLGEKDGNEKVTTFAAFLDTGASGIAISKQTAGHLGVKSAQAVVFHDIGVGGTDRFGVSEPLYFSVGPYQALGGSGGETSFVGAGGPWQCQVGPLEGGGLLAELLGGMDVLGMPVMAGKVMVMDARPVNTFSDVLKVKVVPPGSGEIPQTNRHVGLLYADFAGYTTIEPAGTKKPILVSNPFIGAVGKDPAALKKSPPVVARHGGKSSSGAWLLDTGAAASMISTAQAAALGIRYKNGESAVLEGVPHDQQFTMTVGGIGGSKKAAGFYLQELQITTAEGDPLIYKPAPVLVMDITMEHPETKKKVTLDGVFGMNLLVASAQMTEGLMPDIGKMAEGPYEFIVIDHARGILGLQLRKELGR